MAPSWMSRALPRIQTDIRDLGHSKHTSRRQFELQEGSSTSSSSRNSSFLVTPSSSRPSHSPVSARHHDEQCYVSDEGGGWSYRWRHTPFEEVRDKTFLDVELTHKPIPFEETDQSLPSWWGRSKTRTRAKHKPKINPDVVNYITDANRHTSSCEKPPTQPLCSPTPGHSRAHRHLPFPNLSTRDAYDSSDTKSRSHATSQPGSPNTAPSSSNSQQGKHKLGPHRFLVAQKVGEGGFGQVYKAIEIHSGHTVAIKTVSRKGLSRSRVDATLKEQKIAQRIARHQRQAIGNGGDYVVRMLASFLTPNHFVFILDYHGAGDLRDVDFPLKTEHARFYIGEMTLGLRFIHSLGIVMRDLKPANVLLDFDGHIKVADFGLSAMTDQPTNSASSNAEPERSASVLAFVRTRTISLGSSSLNIPTFDLGNGKRSKTASKAPKLFTTRRSKIRNNEQQCCPMVFCGTPGYISPEGYKGRYGPENDMWALGISLYEFITGENPFDMWGVPTVEIQKKVEGVDILYPEGMPEVTRDIIGQLLKRKWQKRMTIEGMMEHPFFHTNDFSWDELKQKKIAPPPLPDIAQRRLRRSREAASQQSQVPLILHLEAETMRMKDGFTEELGAQEMCDFEMDRLDVLSSLTEERRVEILEDDVWW